MIELLNNPSAAESCSVVRKFVSKLNNPAADAASIFCDAASSTNELISRTDSDSMCATKLPSGPSTSIPFRKVPAHSRPCESTDNAEMRLLVSDWRVSLQRAKRISELLERWMPSLLSSHSSPASVVRREPVETATLFHFAGIVCRRCEKPASVDRPNISPLSLHNTS